VNALLEYLVLAINESLSSVPMDIDT